MLSIRNYYANLLFSVVRLLFCKHLFVLMIQLFGEMYFGQQSKNWPWPYSFLVWKVYKNELIPILFTYFRINQFKADGKKKNKHN